MGFDKPDLGFVVHLGAPPSPIAYYQQVGRAGRGVDRAEVMLLPGREDEAIWQYFASPRPSRPRSRSAGRSTHSRRPGSRSSTAALETRVDLRRTRLEMMLKVLDVDGAVRRVKRRLDRHRAALGLRRRALRPGRPPRREVEQQAMREYRPPPSAGWRSCAASSTTRRRRSCGRCDAATGGGRTTRVTPRPWRSAGQALGRAGVEVEPRQAVADRDGRARRPPHAAGSRPASGRRPAAPWAASPTSAGAAGCAPLLAENAGDGPVPEDVVNALVRVLGDWSRGPDGWSGRAPGPSDRDRHPALAAPAAADRQPGGEDRGDRAPARGRPRSTTCRRDGRPLASNSAQRVLALHDAFVLPAELEQAAPAGGPLLLVDDVISTGWTMAMAARRLRLAGCPAVLPLALALDA